MAEPEKKELIEHPEPEAPEPKEDKPEPKVSEDDNGNVTVDLAPEPKERRPRRERREERQDELRRYRDEAEALRGRMAQMEAHLAQRQYAPQQPPGEDPYERELTKIRGQQELIQSALRSGSAQSAEEVDRLRRQFYELDGQTRKLERDRIRTEVMGEMRRERGNTTGEYEEQALRSEYPDIVTHPQAMRYATGLYYQMVAEGKPTNLATSRKAMDQAAERFGLRQAAVPTASASERQRYGAVAAQAGQRSTSEVRLDKDQKRMAVARWPQLDEHQAYTKMAALLHKTEAEGKGAED
jgi:hypothetical protein